jgi:Protein of unknown function (DUF2800).
MTVTNGRPVDIEIVPRAHAILSASSAERWLVCTPSARIEEQLPDQHSGYASDGTAAHAFAETRLRWLLKQITKAEYEAAYMATKTLYAEIVEGWEVSDWEAIDSYVEYVLSEAERLDATVNVEARVDYSEYAPEGFGTSDALLVSKKHKIIKSIDLKFGKGVPVTAFENAQAKLYALGGLLGFDPHHQIENVEWAIVQPRLDYTGEGGTSVEELLDWAENVVAPAAELAWEGKGKLVPTDKGCRFCKAAATCRARAAQNVLIARRDFKPVPDIDLEEYLMSMEEVARILPDIDGWIQWANALKTYALESARDRGEKIEGYKLVRGRSVRSWSPNKDIPIALKSAGVSETDIYAPPSVRSVAQLEKVLGKKPFEVLTSSNDLVTKLPGTPALVADSDPRPAINRAAEAAAEFAAE